jgi:DNA polymerase-3 subunit alpha
MKELIRKLLPDTFDDIVALVALFRPGPLQSGMVDDFVARKHGRAEVHYPHPLLEQILKPTYGVIVYQEQVMQIAQLLAGYTLGGADMLRRAMGKKKPEEMAKERVKFESGAEALGVDARRASAIFDLMEKFAEYGFNKSHSAAYALVAYQTAWLKAHYPSEFMAAVLSADMDKTDKVVHILADARELGLDVLPPDVNAGEYLFAALPDGRVRYGLGAIKGVGRAAVEAIASERERGGVYIDLADLTQRVDPTRLGKRVLEALTLAGALDALGPNRASIWNALSEAMRAADQHVRDRAAGQHGLFGDGATQRVPVVVATLPDWPAARKLGGERDTLGHYLSGHPTDAYREWLVQLTGAPIAQAETLYKPPPPGNEWRRNDANPVVLAGVVAELRRRNDQMAFIVLEDGSGRIEASFFREAMTAYGGLLSKDALLVVEGSLQLDEFSGTVALRAKRALTLEQACERAARAVVVRVRDARPDLPQRLAAVLSGFRPGQTPVRLVYANQTGETGLDLGDAWRVRAVPALIDALKGLADVLAVDLLIGRLPAASDPHNARPQTANAMA